jgi:poly-gamma-glutamate capsule biosynthesis protein CapA/YwtB (metallophosphatase superfamily)
VPLAAVTPRLRALALDGVDPVRAALTPAYPLVTRGHIEADAATPGRQEVAARLQAALATDAPPPVRLAFTGDIIPTRCVYDAIRRTGDWAAPFRATAARLESADLTIGSLDAAISGRGTPIGCRETFSLLAPPGVVEGLTLAGFDAITVATNHVKDCGVSGCGDLAFLDTLDILRRAGIKPVGGGRTATEAHAPVLLEAGSVRFALLAYDDIAAWLHTTGDAPGTAGLDPEVVAAAVAAARARADVVIVLPQWGEEYTPHPTSRQQLVARRAIEAGATLIVGNHAHVVQAAAPLGDGYVAYALGNFVFDQDWSRETTEGVVLEATFHGPRLAAVDLLPVRIRDRLQPVFLSPEDGRAILARISDAATRLSP